MCLVYSVSLPFLSIQKSDLLSNIIIGADVPQEALNQAYQKSAMIWRRLERKRRSLVVAETEEQTGRFFLEYGKMLTEVPLFKSLGQMFLSSKKNWLAVEHNLWQERGKWVRLVKILGREGEDRIMAERFYVAAMQAVLLFE